MDVPWLPTPIGKKAERWRTIHTKRVTLAVIHTMASMGHVLDAVELLEPDQRVQTVFTQAPDLFNNGVQEWLRHTGALTIGWHQATNTDFDLVIAGDRMGVEALSGSLVAVGHGVPNNKLAAAAFPGAPRPLVVGLSRPWLTTWYGRLVPAAIPLPHRNHVAVLARECPEAIPLATVTGDLCLDRLTASRLHCQRYRLALGLDDDRTLVVVSSTWGSNSLLARTWDALGDLVQSLPADEFHTAVVVHPAAWWSHGPRQVARWLRGHRRTELSIVDPATWRGLISAADVLVGDHGSVTLYAAATGVPVLRAIEPVSDTAPGSAAERLAAVTPALQLDRPLSTQLRLAMKVSSRTGTSMTHAITSEPGRAAALLRAQLYRLLRLSEPDHEAVATPVDPPVVAATGKDYVQ